MRDSDCVAFLQWALPRLHMRWPGFRKVRRTVGKRIDARLKELGLADVADYRVYLETTAAEWQMLDALCTLTISRFYRDRAAFEFLGGVVLPQIAARVEDRGRHEMRVWICGCASGEEAYTLMMVWRLRVEALAPHVRLRVVGTDIDAAALERARIASYGWSSLKDLPCEWRERSFERCGDQYRLHAELRRDVEFFRQDVRTVLPRTTFDLVLCRNLVFTYFDEPLQRYTLRRILSRLLPHGALVIGKGESLPPGEARLEPWSATRGVYRYAATATAAMAKAPHDRRVAPVKCENDDES